MNIVLTYDQPVNTLPAGFVNALNAVVQFYDTHYNNPITITIDVGYGEIGPNNTPLGQNELGESNTFFNSYSYSAIRSALIANASSPAQLAAVSTLPASDPTPGGNGVYYLSTAEAKALGLPPGSPPPVDGYIGFASTSEGVNFTYNTTNGGSVAPGTYDFFGVAAHEISEVLGRSLFVGDQDNAGIGPNSYTPLDLFHYSGNGQRDFMGTQAGYFSVNGGATNLDNFNTDPNGDFGDWASSAGNDAFLAFSNSGVGNAVSAADIEELNVLGYDVPGPAPAGFVGDFNNDTHSDLLWQATNGDPTMWLMNGTTITTSAGLPNPTAAWHVIATGDFNADGNSDILWQNADGAAAIWEMNGTSTIGAVVLANPGASWHAITAADFNGDGRADILWQNTDGAAAIWEMNGTSIIGAGVLPNPGASWHAITTGDFNDDGKADILWQNTNGQAAIWEMNGTSIIGAGVLPNPGTAWHPVATADFNGDGHADIIWQNTDGQAAIWEMSGTSIIGAATLPNLGASWKLIGAGNYNNQKPDLVFENTTTDQVQIWVMNGMNVSSMQSLPVNAPSTARPASAGTAANPLSATPILAQPDVFLASTSGSALETSATGTSPKTLFTAA
jgi:hypothetical protein